MGWSLAGLITSGQRLDQIYTRAHWPSDVLDGILIAVDWISFWVSLRWVSDKALAA